MKADRELLELAAKAIGLTLRYNYLGGRDANQPWDPLEYDGEALRLAVSIPILNLQWIIAEAWQAHNDHESRMGYVRRAIVRAAAAIGEQMRD